MEYERIEREDVPAMRLDDKARTSDKERGNELESALVRPQSGFARADPRDCCAAPHRKPGRAFPVGLSANRRSALARGHAP